MKAHRRRDAVGDGNEAAGSISDVRKMEERGLGLGIFFFLFCILFMLAHHKKSEKMKRMVHEL